MKRRAGAPFAAGPGDSADQMQQDKATQQRSLVLAPYAASAAGNC